MLLYNFFLSFDFQPFYYDVPKYFYFYFYFILFFLLGETQGFLDLWLEISACPHPCSTSLCGKLTQGLDYNSSHALWFPTRRFSRSEGGRRGQGKYSPGSHCGRHLVFDVSLHKRSVFLSKWPSPHNHLSFSFPSNFSF